MPKNKIREIEIETSSGRLSFLKSGSSKKNYDFEGVSLLRKLLSNEKIKIFNTIKNENPSSIYDLSKKLNRNFKSVFADLKLLERFGFIDLIEETANNRKRLKPILDAETMTINIKI
jgi:predicted transcriptional regulator